MVKLTTSSMTRSIQQDLNHVRIHGLPKMHKVQDHSLAPLLKPIVSLIGTFNYNTAKYLCTLLNPHIPTDYCAQDTFTFGSEVTKL